MPTLTPSDRSFDDTEAFKAALYDHTSHEVLPLTERDASGSYVGFLCHTCPAKLVLEEDVWQTDPELNELWRQVEREVWSKHEVQRPREVLDYVAMRGFDTQCGIPFEKGDLIRFDGHVLVALNEAHLGPQGPSLPHLRGAIQVEWLLPFHRVAARYRVVEDATLQLNDGARLHPGKFFEASGDIIKPEGGGLISVVPGWQHQLVKRGGLSYVPYVSAPLPLAR